MVVDHQRRTAIMENAHLVLTRQASPKAMVRSSATKAARSFFEVYDPCTITRFDYAGKLALAAFAAQHRRKPREVDAGLNDHVIDAVIAAMPQFAGIKDAAPDATAHSWAAQRARTASLHGHCGDARQYQRRTTSAADKTPCSPSQWKNNFQPTAHR